MLVDNHIIKLLFIVHILRPTVTFSMNKSLPEASVYPKVNRTELSGNTNRHYASGLNVTVTSGFFMPETNMQHITFFYKQQTPISMTTIAKNGAGESFIHYQIRGGTAEYVAHLHALVTALSGAPLTDDEKASLGDLLVSMLPDENQIKTGRK